MEERYFKENNWKRSCESSLTIFLFLSNEDMNNINKSIKSLEDLGVLTGAVTEILNYEIKKTRRQISWSFVSNISRFNSATSNFCISKRYK